MHMKRRHGCLKAFGEEGDGMRTIEMHQDGTEVTNAILAVFCTIMIFINILN